MKICSYGGIVGFDECENHYMSVVYKRNRHH